MYRHKNDGKNEQGVSDLLDNIRQCNMHAITISKGKKREKG